MAVEVRVPTVLRKHTGGSKVVEAHGPTVRAVLEELEERYPGLRSELFDASGALRQFVNIYVNDEDIRYLAKLETRVNEGDVIAILPAVAGGASAAP